MQLHDSRKFTLEECQEWFLKNQNNYWMIHFDEVVIGYFRFIKHSTESTIAEIGMDLDPTFHGRKLARTLYLDFCSTIVRSNGVESLILRVLKRNVVALSLYKSIGFQIDEESETDYRMFLGLSTLIANLETVISPHKKIELS